MPVVNNQKTLKICNNTACDRGFHIGIRYIGIPSMSCVVIPDQVSDDVRKLFNTPLYKNLLDAKIFTFNEVLKEEVKVKTIDAPEYLKGRQENVRTSPVITDKMSV